jgi:hypothetical protein
MTISLRTACVPVTLQSVHDLLAAGRFDLSTEARTQADIDTLFAGSFGPGAYAREHRLGPKDRPDFLVGGAIVVEVKHFRASPLPTLRQLARYAAYPQVEAVILASGRTVAAPPDLRGKPLVVVSLGSAWL